MPSLIELLGQQLGHYIERDEVQEESEASKRLLEHILGPKQKQVESSIGKASGLDSQSVSKLMSMLGPVVLGSLGRQQKENKMDSDGLSKYLGQQREEFKQANPKQSSMFEKMLDQDGDSDFDIGDMASLVGQLFKG